jgi:hypothetical protein
LGVILNIVKCEVRVAASEHFVEVGLRGVHEDKVVGEAERVDGELAVAVAVWYFLEPVEEGRDEKEPFKAC